MLTTIQVKSAKAQERDYKLADSGGLYLRSSRMDRSFGAISSGWAASKANSRSAQRVPPAGRTGQPTRLLERKARDTPRVGGSSRSYSRGTAIAAAPTSCPAPP